MCFDLNSMRGSSARKGIKKGRATAKGKPSKDVFENEEGLVKGGEINDLLLHLLTL